MGQAADDLIEGFVCSECGIYFEQEHGYPVLCKDCHHRATLNGKRSELPEATEAELGTNESPTIAKLAAAHQAALQAIGGIIVDADLEGVRLAIVDDSPNTKVRNPMSEYAHDAPEKSWPSFHLAVHQAGLVAHSYSGSRWLITGGTDCALVDCWPNIEQGFRYQGTSTGGVIRTVETGTVEEAIRLAGPPPKPDADDVRRAIQDAEDF